MQPKYLAHLPYNSQLVLFFMCVAHAVTHNAADGFGKVAAVSFAVHVVWFFGSLGLFPVVRKKSDTPVGIWGRWISILAQALLMASKEWLTYWIHVAVCFRPTLDGADDALDVVLSQAKYRFAVRGGLEVEYPYVKKEEEERLAALEEEERRAMLKEDAEVAERLAAMQEEGADEQLHGIQGLQETQRQVDVDVQETSFDSNTSNAF